MALKDGIQEEPPQNIAELETKTLEQAGTPSQGGDASWRHPRLPEIRNSAPTSKQRTTATKTTTTTPTKTTPTKTTPTKTTPTKTTPAKTTPTKTTAPTKTTTPTKLTTPTKTTPTKTTSATPKKVTTPTKATIPSPKSNSPATPGDTTTNFASKPKTSQISKVNNDLSCSATMSSKAIVTTTTALTKVTNTLVTKTNPNTATTTAPTTTATLATVSRTAASTTHTTTTNTTTLTTTTNTTTLTTTTNTTTLTTTTITTAATTTATTTTATTTTAATTTAAASSIATATLTTITTSDTYIPILSKQSLRPLAPADPPPSSLNMNYPQYQTPSTGLPPVNPALMYVMYPNASYVPTPAAATNVPIKLQTIAKKPIAPLAKASTSKKKNLKTPVGKLSKVSKIPIARIPVTPPVIGSGASKVPLSAPKKPVVYRIDSPPLEDFTSQATVDSAPNATTKNSKDSSPSPMTSSFKIQPRYNLPYYPSHFFPPQFYPPVVPQYYMNHGQYSPGSAQQETYITPTASCRPETGTFRKRCRPETGTFSKQKASKTKKKTSTGREKVSPVCSTSAVISSPNSAPIPSSSSLSPKPKKRTCSQTSEGKRVKLAVISTKSSEATNNLPNLSKKTSLKSVSVKEKKMETDIIRSPEVSSAIKLEQEKMENKLLELDKKRERMIHDIEKDIELEKKNCLEEFELKRQKILKGAESK
eukprot:Awhi_evm1s4725